MLGRFLEISLFTPDIQASLEFYEALGFVQGTVGEAWPHAYAVVSDGHLTLGLHTAGIDIPCLTYVQPELARKLEPLEARAISFTRVQLDPEVFNEVMFRAPEPLDVRLIEARTFSPPQIEPGRESA